MSEFKLTMKTIDGSLITDRNADKDLFFICRGRPDKEFVDYTLERECREKGVRLVEHAIDETGIECLVEYL